MKTISEKECRVLMKVPQPYTDADATATAPHSLTPILTLKKKATFPSPALALPYRRS